ncbi:MAG: tRNA-splicing ligase RtcB [Candidatus Woesearchaeota archaeon]|jgi:tRNA-splicing ligase RtcB
MEIKKITDVKRVLQTAHVPVVVYASDAIFEKMQQDKTLTQAINVSALPGICKHMLVMPDAHQGYGFPIGGVAAMDATCGCISPGGIGFDINCGVRAHVSELTKDDISDKLEAIAEALYKTTPVGQGGKGNAGQSELRLTHEELDELLAKGLPWAKDRGYATDDDIARTESNGCLSEADPSLITPTGKKRGKNQVGSLGSGNHFLELQYVDEIYDEAVAKEFRIHKKGQLVLMIHSGSRGLGHQTCSDFIQRMAEEFTEIFDSLPEKDLIYAPLSSDIAKEYYAAMCACANFAWVNRFMIAYNAIKAFETITGDASFSTIYDVAHNIAKKESHVIDGKLTDVMVHRKGATRAFAAGHPELIDAYQKTGHPVLIPGSMGTPSFVCVGTQKGMEETFGSTAHGSGRVMGRRRAHEEIDGEQVAAELLARGIIVKAPRLSEIADEAPQVYKNSEEVVQVNEDAGITRKIARLQPLCVIKG